MRFIAFVFSIVSLFAAIQTYKVSHKALYTSFFIGPAFILMGYASLDSKMYSTLFGLVFLGLIIMAIVKRFNKRVTDTSESIAIDILGTSGDGTFIANINFEGKSFYVYYPAHVGNEVILHTTPDAFTRFVVFYENDTKLHSDCKNSLMREDLHVNDLFQTGLEDLFRKAMASSRLKEKNDEKKNA